MPINELDVGGLVLADASNWGFGGDGLKPSPSKSS